MAKTVSDLWPQSSGVASLGAEMTNNGFTGAIRPFNHVHLVSGIWHSPLGGQSGVIRFNQGDDQYVLGTFSGITPGFDFSINGGQSFPIRVGGTKNPSDTSLGVIDTPLNGELLIHADKMLKIQGEQVYLVSDFGINMDAQDISFLASAQVIMNAATINVTSTNDTLFQTSGPLADMSFISNHNLVFQTFLQSTFFAFNTSGVLEYRFGPYQSWAIKTSHSATGGPANDGFWPIAHSGNLNQRFNQHGLQQSYNAGRVAVIDSTIGDLQLVSNTAQLILSTFGTYAEVNMSGLFNPPTLSNLVVGDLFMMNHSVISGIVGLKDTATMKAKALGPGTLGIQTGSGVINVSVGSGLAQYVNVNTQAITTAFADVVMTFINECGDRNYGMTNGVVTVFSPGLYKVTWGLTAEKTAGTAAQTVETRLIKNNVAAALFGSTTASFHLNITTAARNSIARCVLVNLNTRDDLRLQVSSTLDTTDTTQIINRGCTFIIEKIGPMRTAFQ